MSAEIIRLCDRRAQERDRDPDDACIDLVTAVDVAIRDLRDIAAGWGSDQARQRLAECEQMLKQAFAGA